MANPDHSFNLRVSFTVIRHGFHHSLGEGFQAIRDEAINVVSRFREIGASEKPFPDFAYDIVNGRLHWPGDELPVDYHYRAHISWLKGNGGTEEQVNHAKLELANFLKVQGLAVGLDDGQAAMWLSQRNPEPANGVALQQIRKEGARLIQSSQLLPFDQQSQIDSFQDEISQGRDDVSIDDSVGGWIVQGQALNFKKDVPGIIDHVYQAERSLFGVTPQFAQSRWQELPGINSSNLFKSMVLPIQAANVTETARPTTTTTGFWFEAMAMAAEPMAVDTLIKPELGINVVEIAMPEKAAILEKPASSFASPEKALRADIISIGEKDKVPTKLNLEVEKQVEPAKTVFASKKEERRQTSSRVPEVKAIKRPERKTVKIFETAKIEAPMKTPIGLNLEVKKQAESERTIFERHKKPSGRVPEMKKEPRKERKTTKGEKAVFQARMPKKREAAGKSETISLPPIYNIPRWFLEPQVFNENEIPVWQIIFADAGDENNAITLLIVTSFFLIANTKWLRSDEVRGSGNSLVRTVFSAS